MKIELVELKIVTISLIASALVVSILVWSQSWQITPSYDSTGNQRIEIQMTTKQWEFSPASISVKKGQTISLRIRNIDVTHGFALPEFGVQSVTIPAGETVTVRFIAARSGTFVFYCTVFCGTGHPNHRGTLIVTEQ